MRTLPSCHGSGPSLSWSRAPKVRLLLSTPALLPFSQVGSGTAELGALPCQGKVGYFDGVIGDEEFEEGRARALSEGVRLRDKEHLAYFRVFRRETAAHRESPRDIDITVISGLCSTLIP